MWKCFRLVFFLLGTFFFRSLYFLSDRVNEFNLMRWKLQLHARTNQCHSARYFFPSTSSSSSFFHIFFRHSTLEKRTNKRVKKSRSTDSKWEMFECKNPKEQSVPHGYVYDDFIAKSRDILSLSFSRRHRQRPIKIQKLLPFIETDNRISIDPFALVAWFWYRSKVNHWTCEMTKHSHSIRTISLTFLPN